MSMALVERADLLVIGGGILGLATAREMLMRRPGLRVLVVEREPELAAHQTGNNSGVVHAGLYYTPGSLKARLCREGKVALEAYCAERGIEVQRVGKLVVALTEGELPRFEALEAKARENGVEGLETVGPERIRELEPHVLGIRGLWSPGTGIVDFRAVANAYADDIRAAGGTIETGRAVTGLEERPDGVLVETSGGDVLADRVVACAGLWSDRVAALTGDDGSERIVPFRGDYYRLTPDARTLVRGLIYPVPDPRFPFLGIHFTRRHDGAVWAGPNAVLALARDGYKRYDVDLREVIAIAGHAGFRRLARRFWRTGLGAVARPLEGGVRGRAPALRPGAAQRSTAVRAVRRPSSGDRPRRDARRRLPAGRQPADRPRPQRAVAGGDRIAGHRPGPCRRVGQPPCRLTRDAGPGTRLR